MSFLAGFGIDFALGVLFAPMRGEEMRQVISEKSNQTFDRAQGIAVRAKEVVQRVPGEQEDEQSSVA
jgi:gas vesicle protein